MHHFCMMEWLFINGNPTDMTQVTKCNIFYDKSIENETKKIDKKHNTPKVMAIKIGVR